jgi:hypothetical protein
MALRDRLASVLDRLRGRRRRRERTDPPPDRPPPDPALVPTGPPRGPRPALGAEAELPEPYEFEDHAEHPRRGDE